MRKFSNGIRRGIKCGVVSNRRKIQFYLSAKQGISSMHRHHRFYVCVVLSLHCNVSLMFLRKQQFSPLKLSCCLFSFICSFSVKFIISCISFSISFWEKLSVWRQLFFAAEWGTPRMELSVCRAYDPSSYRCLPSMASISLWYFCSVHESVSSAVHVRSSLWVR